MILFFSKIYVIIDAIIIGTVNLLVLMSVFSDYFFQFFIYGLLLIFKVEFKQKIYIIDKFNDFQIKENLIFFIRIIIRYLDLIFNY